MELDSLSNIAERKAKDMVEKAKMQLVFVAVELDISKQIAGRPGTKTAVR